MVKWNIASNLLAYQIIIYTFVIATCLLFSSINEMKTLFNEGETQKYKNTHGPAVVEAKSKN